MDQKKIIPINQEEFYLLGYAAADAWPLTGFRDLPLSPSTSQEDFNKIYTNNIVRGEPCLEARVEVNPIKMPYPPSNSIRFNL